MDALCEVCREQAPKYKCPRCSLRTCSLPCVKQHKTENNCDGIREKTKYIEISKFTDIDLLSDYRFLEDAGRKADAANRDNFQNRNRGNWQRKKLLRQCQRHSIRLMSMPYSMTKRQQNRSRVNFQTQSIVWMVEWIFPEAKAKYKDSVDDTIPLSSCLKKFLDQEESDPVIRQKLKHYVSAGVDHVNVFMKVEGLRADCLRYYQFHKGQSLCDNLKGKLIIEYPSLYVVLSEKTSQYPLIQDGEEQQLSEFQKLVTSSAQNPEWHHDSRGRHRGRFARE